MTAILKHLTPRRMVFFMVLGSAVFALYLYFSIGVDKLITVFESLNFPVFLFFYALSFATMFLTMLSWTFSWRRLLKALSIELNVKKTFLYYLAGDFVDRIIPSPGVAGEFTRAYFIQKETLSGYGVIVAAGITNRIVSYGVVVGGLTVGIAFLLLTETIPAFASGFLLIVWLGALALFALLSFVSLKENAAEKLVFVLAKILKIFRIRRDSDAFVEKTYRFLSRFHDGFKFYGANPHYLLGPTILNMGSFILNLVVYIFVFYALGFPNMPVDFFLVVYFLSGAVQDGFAAFSVGGLEILLTSVFILYGIPAAASGVAAVVLRMVTFYFPLILGYSFIQMIGARNVLTSDAMKEIETEQQ